jgi:hypothetical protein
MGPLNFRIAQGCPRGLAFCAPLNLRPPGISFSLDANSRQSLAAFRRNRMADGPFGFVSKLGYGKAGRLETTVLA